MCHKCGLKDHFEAQCKTKPKQEFKNNTCQQKRNTANLVNPEDEKAGYAFIVGSTMPERIEVVVGGCKLNMIIDSGTFNCEVSTGYHAANAEFCVISLL